MKGKKGLNIKALFANHIEKIGFGLIALLVLGVWAAEFLGGAWARTKENPNAMLQDIDRKRKEIEASRWPADLKEKFALVNFQQQAASLLKPIDASKYDLSTTLFEPLNKPKEKAREPEWMTVEHLRADWGHVILALMPEEDYYEGENETDDEQKIIKDKESPEEKSEEGEDDDIARRDVASDFGGDFEGVMDEVPAMLGGKAKGPRGKQTMALPGAQPTGGAALAGQAKADSAGFGRGGKSHRTTSGQRPKGMFYVAVRGTFNLRQQLEKIQKALHLDTRMSAREFFQILDFELERQTAAAGDDPWTKEWEPLNILYAKQVLSEVDGFDDEPFDMQVFDPVMTMPLPMRMFGLWKDHATHPNLKSFQIPPEEQQKLNALRARMMEEYEKMELQEQKARGPKRGGFADDVVDMRSMITTMERTDARGMQTMLRTMGKDMGGVRGLNVQGQGQIPIHKLFTEITADGRLLLFRYFDFDVQPGYAYRYRVKLKLVNPNHERPVSEVVDRSVAEGEERWTDYSKASNAAVMPVSPTYFLKHVEKNPLADHGRAKRTIASVNIYEWHRELGTRVFDTLGLNSLGQFLGGKAKTTILDVAEPSMDDGEYVFATEDILVDAVGDPDLIPSDHPDLKLKEPGRGMKTVALGLATEAMVVGQGGDLRQLEADGESAREKSIRQAAERERGPFKDLKKKDEENEGALDMLRNYDDENPILGRQPKGKGNKGSKGGKGNKAEAAQAFARMGGPQASTNPLRKGRGQSAGGPAGAMMAPAMMEQGGFGAGGGRARRTRGGGGDRGDR